MIPFPFRRQITRWLRRRLDVPLSELALERLKHAGFKPRELLDVGASYGIFIDAAWKVWPDLKVHCFEPEPDFFARLKTRAAHDPRMTVTQTLVGAHPEAKKTYYHILGWSSLCKEHVEFDPKAPLGTAGPEQSCQMITLDDYCREKKIQPDFLKVDVQGYDLEVLRGAEKTLPSIEVIQTEVNHIDIYDGAPLAAELIGWLAERGYALHDVCNLMRRPLDKALWQTDMIFVRHTSPLRYSKWWGKSTK